jgi:prepilin-type processing-associated H-X9-DG protein
MLAVVGVVVVLIALLLPAVGRARRQSRQAVCASHLHQIYLAGQAWKVDNEGRGNPRAFQAYGWMEEWSAFVANDRRVYNCPEDPSLVNFGADVPRGGDQGSPTTPAPPAGGTPGAGGTAGGGGTSAAGTAGDLGDLFLRTIPDVNSPGVYYDLAFKEGPWVQKKNATANSYELWAEHQFWNDGAKLFDDVGVKVTRNSDGTVTAQLLARDDFVHLPYRNDVMAKGGDGRAVPLFTNAYQTDPNAPSSPVGSKAALSDATDEFDGGAGAGAGGKPGSSTAGGSGTPGGGASASYGFNTNLRWVDGKSDKVLATDYFYSVIDPAKEDWAAVATDRDGRPVFARHSGLANVLYADGSVRPAAPSKTSLNPAFADNRVRYWEK